jgi:hypothetical protein
MAITFSKKIKPSRPRGRPLITEEKRDVQMTCTIKQSQLDGLTTHVERLGVPRSELVRRALDLWLQSASGQK